MGANGHLQASSASHAMGCSFEFARQLDGEGRQEEKLTYYCATFVNVNDEPLSGWHSKYTLLPLSLFDPLATCSLAP